MVLTISMAGNGSDSIEENWLMKRDLLNWTSYSTKDPGSF